MSILDSVPELTSEEAEKIFIMVDLFHGCFLTFSRYHKKPQ